MKMIDDFIQFFDWLDGKIWSTVIGYVIFIVILLALSCDRWRRWPEILHADSSVNGKIQINCGGGRQKRAGRGQ
jgi:hypothetical protein